MVLGRAYTVYFNDYPSFKAHLGDQGLTSPPFQRVLNNDHVEKIRASIRKAQREDGGQLGWLTLFVVKVRGNCVMNDGQHRVRALELENQATGLPAIFDVKFQEVDTMQDALQLFINHYQTMPISQVEMDQALRALEAAVCPTEQDRALQLANQRVQWIKADIVNDLTLYQHFRTEKTSTTAPYKVQDEYINRWIHCAPLSNLIHGPGDFGRAVWALSEYVYVNLGESGRAKLKTQTRQRCEGNGVEAAKRKQKPFWMGAWEKDPWLEGDWLGHEQLAGIVAAERPSKPSAVAIPPAPPIPERPQQQQPKKARKAAAM